MDLHKCPICFQNRRMGQFRAFVPCGHMTCGSCIQGYTSDGGAVRCHTCRQPCTSFITVYPPEAAHAAGTAAGSGAALELLEEKERELEATERKLRQAEEKLEEAQGLVSELCTQLESGGAEREPSQGAGPPEASGRPTWERETSSNTSGSRPAGSGNGRVASGSGAGAAGRPWELMRDESGMATWLQALTTEMLTAQESPPAWPSSPNQAGRHSSGSRFGRSVRLAFGTRPDAPPAGTSAGQPPAGTPAGGGATAARAASGAAPATIDDALDELHELVRSTMQVLAPTATAARTSSLSGADGGLPAGGVGLSTAADHSGRLAHSGNRSFARLDTTSMGAGGPAASGSHSNGSGTSSARPSFNPPRVYPTGDAVIPRAAPHTPSAGTPANGGSSIPATGTFSATSTSRPTFTTTTTTSSSRPTFPAASASHGGSRSASVLASAFADTSPALQAVVSTVGLLLDEAMRPSGGASSGSGSRNRVSIGATDHPLTPIGDLVRGYLRQAAHGRH